MFLHRSVFFLFLLLTRLLKKTWIDFRKFLEVIRLAEDNKRVECDPDPETFKIILNRCL